MAYSHPNSSAIKPRKGWDDRQATTGLAKTCYSNAGSLRSLTADLTRMRVVLA